jgi:phosphatidylinositol 4-kinase
VGRRQSNAADEFAEKMRAAAVMLAQLTPPSSHGAQRSKADTEAIKQKIIKEMTVLEEERMKKFRQGLIGDDDGGEVLEDETVVLSSVNKEDPSGRYCME